MNWTQLPPSRPDGHSSSGRRGQFILALAPLADHTDSPFCCVCRKVFNNCHSDRSGGIFQNVKCV